MKKYYVSYLFGILLIFLSTPLGYFSTNTLGRIKGNLTSEYVPLLIGFIFSYIVIGVLIFIAGMVSRSKNK